MIDLRRLATSAMVAVVLAHLAGPNAHAVTIGDVDTFSSGLAGWQKGQVNATFLSVASSGGPAGDGDAYMRSVADGSSSFGRLTVFNQAQWNSTFLDSGVTAIRMDLLNSGTVPLQVRLALRNSSGAGFISSSPVPLGVGGGWQSFDFPVTQAALTSVGSPGSYPSFLASGFAFRIVHATSTANLNGNPVVSTLGIDNITAVPEPSTYCMALAGLACGGYSLFRRRNRA